jgi:CheY-like chemotaxis protein
MTPELTLNSPTALVADDDADSRDLLIEGLEQLGYRVVPAVDGADLIKRLSELDGKEVWLVVTDLDMPRVGGFAALDVVRQKLPHATVVVVTGWRDAIIQAEAKARGAEAVFIKPFNMRELGRFAARGLDGSNAR